MVMALVASTKLGMSSPVNTRIGDLWQNYYPGNYSGHSAWPLAVSPWVSAMSTDNGYSHCWGRNRESCIVVGPATRTD